MVYDYPMSFNGFAAKLTTARMPIQLPIRDRAKIFIERCGLFAVLSQEFPVRINLESRLFAVRCNEDLVVPSAIGIVFPEHLNDVSACRLLFNGLLDRCGERFEINLFSGMFSRLSSRAQSKPDAESRY
jgi:hypothetical protein